LIRCNIDAVISRHLGGLRAMGVFEVFKREAENTMSTDVARLCVRIKKSKQKKWGITLSGQKSKMMLVETACRPLAQIGADKVRRNEWTAESFGKRERIRNVPVAGDGADVWRRQLYRLF
jgi:hypothetical protein